MFVKICGTTNEEDALLAVAMGADALGFVFAPSPRQVAAGHVADIVKRVPPEILTVGVFRNDTPERVIDIVIKTGIRGVQLHGNESPQTVAFIKSKLPLVVIKAFPAASKEIQRADKYGADVVLLDAPSPGSGQVFDWRLAEGVPDRVRLLLAGGLTPQNVAEAIEKVHPWGVDVVTGVERVPGHKDPLKLREFIQRAKDATPEHVYEQTGDGPYDWTNWDD
jgi:phosphoribosylanthranilate isomerase